MGGSKHKRKAGVMSVVKESNVAGAWIETNDRNEVWVQLFDGECILFRRLRTKESALYCLNYICDQFAEGATMGWVSVDQWADPVPMVIA